MRIRLVDYVGNEGGGVRFTLELMRALSRRQPRIQWALASTGRALVVYRQLVREHGLDCEFLDLPPIQSGRGWTFSPPEAALTSTDVLWFPWVHRHGVPRSARAGIVGSFHDTILLSTWRLRHPVLPRWIAPRTAVREYETTREWMQSSARMVVSSRATVLSLEELFPHVTPRRMSVIALSGSHAAARAGGPATEQSPGEPFVLCPANINPHKNHEALLEGYSRSGLPWPLVLTGGGTERMAAVVPPARRRLAAMTRFLGISRWLIDRPTALHELAVSRGFVFGSTLVARGYVDNAELQGLLQRARALVMPTLMEGGGSFPVEEAIWLGTPVVCSDIPVMREHVGRLGAEVLWFNPRRPEELAAALCELHSNYAQYKQRAVEQITRLHFRTWDDVADDYWREFTEAAAGR